MVYNYHQQHASNEVWEMPCCKSYTVDYLTKKRVKNNGIVPQYYVEDTIRPSFPKTATDTGRKARRANIKKSAEKEPNRQREI